MPVRSRPPITPTFRHTRQPDFAANLSQGNAPEKSLTQGKKSIAGRNNQGRITIRRRGGGHKRLFREIDFLRNKTAIPGKIVSVEYDPNRSAYISLVNYADGEKSYILAVKGLRVGDEIMSGKGAEVRPGNALPLRYLPMGAVVHNIELTPGRGAQLVRTAGSSAQLLGKEGKYAQVRMPSGEIRRILVDAMATVGQLANEERTNVIIGKAGRNRNLGKRPRVRGLAMTPRDHPHGGGEGASSIGMPSPKSKWGRHTLGVKTRHNRRTEQNILRDRRRKK